MLQNDFKTASYKYQRFSEGFEIKFFIQNKTIVISPLLVLAPKKRGFCLNVRTCKQLKIKHLKNRFLEEIADKI
jgi:hypothetical protein